MDFLSLFIERSKNAGMSSLVEFEFLFSNRKVSIRQKSFFIFKLFRLLDSNLDQLIWK